MEMDLVAHCGEVNRGSYVHSLVLTDIASGWIECAPLVVRDGSLVVEGVERIRRVLPFSLNALDTDYGPEFTGKSMLTWAHRNGISVRLIEPGKPNQNAYVESLNGRLRDECLNEHWFTSVTHARAVIENWRREIQRRETEEVTGRNHAQSVRKAVGQKGRYNAGRL